MVLTWLQIDQRDWFKRVQLFFCFYLHMQSGPVSKVLQMFYVSCMV